MLGARIAMLRREAGFSQAELAKRLGISASAVGMYELGHREPAVDILVALAQTFGVSTDYLLTGKPASPGEMQRSEQAMIHALLEADKNLDRRASRPFSRQELTVLFAAMLMDS